ALTIFSEKAIHELHLASFAGNSTPWDSCVKAKKLPEQPRSQGYSAPRDISVRHFEKSEQSSSGNEVAAGGGGVIPSTPRRSKEPSEVSSSEESDDEVMSLCASEDELDKLIGDKSEASNGRPASQKDSGPSPSESVLTELEAAINDDLNLGPKIIQKLTDMTLKRWGKKLSQEKLKTLLSNHEVPENCSKIVVPRVNGEIWSQLNTHRRTSDLRLNNMQKNLLRATCAVLSMCDKALVLNIPKAEQKQIMADGVDTIGLLSHVFSDLTGLRKEQMKPALKSEFHSLCTKVMEEPLATLYYSVTIWRSRSETQRRRLA
ncbi:hypothetical protein AC249_AIPGENE22162, partial [Exaiptasia diaphana]